MGWREPGVRRCGEGNGEGCLWKMGSYGEDGVGEGGGETGELRLAGAAFWFAMVTPLNVIGLTEIV